MIETFDQIVEHAMTRIDHDHINAAARKAAENLERRDAVVVRLEPGDATRYEILIVDRGLHILTGDDVSYSRNYWVCLTNHSFGKSYPWDGQTVHAGYVHEKWVDGHSPHTAAVLTAFLNRLAERLV